MVHILRWPNKAANTLTQRKNPMGSSEQAAKGWLPFALSHEFVHVLALLHDLTNHLRWGRPAWRHARIIGTFS